MQQQALVSLLPTRALCVPKSSFESIFGSAWCRLLSDLHFTATHGAHDVLGGRRAARGVALAMKKK